MNDQIKDALFRLEMSAEELHSQLDCQRIAEDIRAAIRQITAAISGKSNN